MADEEAVVQEGVSPAQSPLVSVSFQRDVNRKQKYLEAEPKFLGVTQIGLSAFQIINVAVFLANDLSQFGTDIAFFISSLLVLIAGSVAVAAQNLHLPTLRACLGMQIVACGASIFNMVCCLVKMEMIYYYCWHYHYDNGSLHFGETCHKIENTQSHFYAEGVLIQVALLAISATLAAYCCKVVNCCAPAPKMPVIVLQAPPAQQ
uniref:membrane-spanning 4-domains subfamily A member 4A-like n=1 Tax=Semicossyphus pulcher TaxID=241346 RepID=UPI0037E7BADA